MNTERKQNIIRMIRMAAQRLEEADSVMAQARVLNTLQAVCRNEYERIGAELCERVDQNISNDQLIQALRQGVVNV